MSDLDPQTQRVIHNVFLLNTCIDIPFLQKQTSTKTGLQEICMQVHVYTATERGKVAESTRVTVGSTSVRWLSAASPSDLDSS